MVGKSPAMKRESTRLRITSRVSKSSATKRFPHRAHLQQSDPELRSRHFFRRKSYSFFFRTDVILASRKANRPLVFPSGVLSFASSHRTNKTIIIHTPNKAIPTSIFHSRLLCPGRSKPALVVASQSTTVGKQEPKLCQGFAM